MELNEAVRQTLDAAMRDANWDIYDCDGPTNTDRSSWGRAAWAAHQVARDRANRSEVEVPGGYEIADVIWDLLHLAVTTTRFAAPGSTVGVGAVLASALGNFAAEHVHPDRCPECRIDATTEAEARDSLIGTRVVSPTGEPGVVIDAELDSREGDRWVVRIEGRDELSRYRAEECHVTGDRADA